MLIETTRFGPIEIDGQRVITFKEGLPGFPGMRRFALIQTSPEPVFFWLQSVDEPGLAFVVCDPLAFVPDFRAGIRADDRCRGSFSGCTCPAVPGAGEDNRAGNSHRRDVPRASRTFGGARPVTRRAPQTDRQAPLA